MIWFSLEKKTLNYATDKALSDLNVGRDVLFIEVTGGYFSSCKVWQLQNEKNSDYKTVSVAQSNNLLDWKLLVLGSFFLCFGGQNCFNFSIKNIVGSKQKSCIKLS